MLTEYNEEEKNSLCLGIQRTAVLAWCLTLGKIIDTLWSPCALLVNRPDHSFSVGDKGPMSAGSDGVRVTIILLCMGQS